MPILSRAPPPKCELTLPQNFTFPSLDIRRLHATVPNMSEKPTTAARIAMPVVDRRPEGWLSVNQASIEWTKQGRPMSPTAVNKAISRGNTQAVRVSAYVAAIDETVERVFVPPTRPHDHRKGPAPE